MGVTTSSEQSNAATQGNDGRAVQRSLQDEKETPEAQVEDETELRGKDEPRISEARFAALCSSLQRIARLQREATTALIDAREKHREASHKRQDVWFSDGKFMDEVRYLDTDRSVARLSELSRLASECQKTRDSLGPVEQETIEAEQRWEGTIWKLRHAEDNFYTDFKRDFETAATYASANSSAPPSPYRSSSGIQSEASTQEIFEIEPHMSYRSVGSEISTSSFALFSPAANQSIILEDELVTRDSILLGMDQVHAEQSLSDEYTEDWESGAGDIDDILARSPPPLALGMSLQLPEGQYINSLNSLLTDFTSIRQRIDRWLENVTLSSRFEAMTLFGILRSKFEGEPPSNWAQLTIAYWELRGIPETNHPVSPTGTISKVKESGATSIPGNQTYVDPETSGAVETPSYAHTYSYRGSSHTNSNSMSQTHSLSMLGSPCSSGSPQFSPQAYQGFTTQVRYQEKQHESP